MPSREPSAAPVIEERLAQELAEYKGRWVAVDRGAIVGVADSAVGAKQQALENGVTDPLVFRVPSHPERLAFLQVPWYEYSPAPSGFSKPYVEVRLWHGNRSVRLLALVDSGCDRSLIDAQYADVLGLDRADAHTQAAVVASGEVVESLHWPNTPLELQFQAHRFPFEGSFFDFGTGDGENLMGRKDFFQRFIVQFWDAAELMNIDLSPDFPLAPPSP